MKFRRIFQAAAALLLSAGMLTGCKVRFNTTPWDSDIVAKPTANISEDLEVTYKEFGQQYRYLLYIYGIEDDADPKYADICAEQREFIIENLILNKIYLKKAAELNIAELTDEERTQVSEDLDSQYDEQAKYFGQKALSEEASGSETSDLDQTVSQIPSDQSADSSPDQSDTSSPSDEEILARGYEEMDKMLAECGFTRDELLKWSEEHFIINKLMDEIAKNITDEDTEERVAEIFKNLEDMYNSDERYYYFQGGYDNLWVPEGSRRIKHVLLGFDDETVLQIGTLREEGKADEADALRAEKADEFSERVEYIEALLDENADFNMILLTYSSDASSSLMYPDGYLVTPDDDRYVKEFAEAAFAIENVGDRTLCTSDYGVHIMIYASDAVPDEESVKDFTNAVYKKLYQDAVDKQTEEWQAEYNYEIDREKLRLEQQSSSSGS